MENQLFDWLLGVITSHLLPFMIKLFGILIFWIIGTKFIKLARKIVKGLLEKGHADKGVVTFLDNFVKFGLYALLFICILESFGVESTSIAAAVASAGVAIGMALQGSLSNLAGGVLILLLKPFKIGDYIIAAGLEGTVTEIQMFNTKLLTGDNRMCVIPNGTLSNGNIINVTAMDKRRVDIIVGIAYSTDLLTAKDVLTNMLQDCPYVLQEEANGIFVNDLGVNSVNLLVRAWAKTSEYWLAKTYLTEQIKLTLDANHIEIPFNQVEVHIDK